MTTENEQSGNVTAQDNTVIERTGKVLRSVFTAHEGAFEAAFGPTEIMGWDSLNHLNLIMALQEEFGIELGFEEMLEIKVVGDIHRVVAEKTK